MRRGRSRASAASALTSSSAPSRGGSISILSSLPKAATLSAVAAKRLATRYSTRPSRPFAAAFSAARTTSSGAALDAENLRATNGRWPARSSPARKTCRRSRSPGCGSRRLTRSPHEHAIDRRIDLRELGRREEMLDAEVGQQIGKRRPLLADGSGRQLAGPLRLQIEDDPVAVGKVAQPTSRHPHSALPERASTRAVTRSPTATSICGRRSRIESAPINSRSGNNIADRCGGSTSHCCISAT
jgi:hypothetical protein